MVKTILSSVILGAGLLSAAEKTIDAFSEPGDVGWRLVAGGRNLRAVAEGGYVDDDGKPALKVEFLQNDPSDKASSGRWFFFDYPLAPDASWNSYEGIAFDVRLDAGSGDYIEPALMEGKDLRFRADLDWAGFKRRKKRPGREYMGPLSREWTTCRLPFADLRDATNADARVDAGKLTALRLGGGASATVVMIRNLRLYRTDKPTREVKPCVMMSVDKDYVGNLANTFQPGQPVRFELTAAGVPPDAAAMEWLVTDYHGKTVADGRMVLSGGGSAAHSVSLGALPTGYYETRVFLLDGSASRISSDSVLKTSGTMPKGVQSFAVVPCTYDENVARMRRCRDDDFFGIMNSRHQYKVHELVGAPWYLDGPRVQWFKRDKIMAEPPREDWMRCDCAFVHWAPSNACYNGVSINPKVMRAGGPEVERHKQFIAEAVRANVHRHPDAPCRVYELSWEADLNSPPFGDLEMDDLVEWWRIVSGIVRENDPKARFWGPKCTHNLAWLEMALAAGIGRYIDEISMHFYIGPEPEAANLPASLGRVRALCRKYLGRELPINNTEGGYYRQPDVLTHAHKLMRYALIQKGEGVSHYLLFYIFDFWERGHVADFGLFYNPTWPLNHGPKQIYPKPAVPAYATMIRLLTGAKPAGRLGGAADGFYGYAFAREDGEVVLALWNPDRDEDVTFPHAGHGVRVTDMMGGVRYVTAKDGVVTLRLTKEPLYVERAETAPGVAPKVVRVARPAEFVSARAETNGTNATVAVRFANGTGGELGFPVSFESVFGKQRGTLRLPAGSEGEIAFAIGPADRGFSTAAPLKGRVVWRVDGTRYSENVEIGFFAAFADGEAAERKGPFSNRARIEGRGADGKKDSAEIALHHSAKGLWIKVAVDDAVHSQDNAVDFLWRGDSLQIAFDTAPGYAYEYDEGIMQTRKKVSDIVVALGPDGPEFYRNRTYSERFLPTGRIAPERMPGSTISRVGGKTVYDLLVPWSEFGLSPEEAKPGLRLGFSLLVNDHDGKGTERTYYGLFGGIADASGHNDYGYFTLMQ